MQNREIVQGGYDSFGIISSLYFILIRYKFEIFVPNQDVFILLMIHGICSTADKISPSARHIAQ